MYNKATDDGVYHNGTMPRWVKDNGVRTARYPGGTIASYWDWENPCGKMVKKLFR